MTNTARHTTAIILAAGLGTRMKSRLPKALHRLGNRPMITHLIDTAREIFDDVVVVVGPDMPELEKAVQPYRTVVQTERLGTAHATNTAKDLFGDGDIAVLYADNPLITADTMRRLTEARQGGASLALLGMRPADPGRYGRIVEEQGRVSRIVEYKDANEQEREIALCNAGVMCAGAADFRRWLAAVGNDNAQGEYYLTDVVAMAASEGRVQCVEAPETELAGVNSRVELAQAEATLQQRLRMSAMEGGVTLVSPETTFFSTDTCLEPDVVVEPNVFFGPSVTVRSGALIRAFSHLEGCTVGEGAMIGPYARLRPGTICAADTHVGNFVELKNVDLGPGAKANHLTYLGDASVGAQTNVGAGTVTCNYDGYFKHRTTIGARNFIGSDAILVAPVTIGDDALIAAGSTITEDVPAGALAFGRARQTIKPDRGLEIKQTLKAKKEQG
ncbi:bifunctional UDP-N-acetylglucosamine diphosphorylase/glucosamine-1-phosphate N-acetyltransferase GlmU [Gluconobacter cerinus]|uniref:bifunctional UDP-N-acetylglucosamine diphosphorylase/glucosamine-1-phosphate N-acetyltransferase GlmU n=1 Tax=Gluconobacter cerinus TaxID=38307 RepID=UPI00193EC853|nr:bifunctional UDP-N-acetylglucosamine diphosphorylase/glucosamine-1-phosphate N-acetyltransferase GlmU [Gluconobacter cerinus]MBM3096425.1 bifunctional UDP-N-acetylglucosamine diphosphorylase/glucosamine-1-phosphate N-acetyltransferase GlmU [Gluconobacter cerinus]